MGDITFLSADSIRQIQRKRQLEFVYQKIIEAVKNFRNTCYLSCDYRIEEENIEYLKDFGYKIKIDVKINSGLYMYSYEISWK